MPAKFGGHMGPPPLRDANHLMGLPNLRAADQAKVDSCQPAVSMCHSLVAGLHDDRMFAFYRKSGTFMAMGFTCNVGQGDTGFMPHFMVCKLGKRLF